MNTCSQSQQQFSTPYSIVQQFNAATIIQQEQNTIPIKGIFKKTQGSGFKGMYYNVLKDEIYDYSITLETPELLHNQLSDNKTIEFTGLITRRIIPSGGGKIEVRVAILNLLTQRTNKYSDEDLTKIELINQKLSKESKDLDAFIKSKITKNESINIKIIVGKTGIIDEDIKVALDNCTPLYQIKFEKISLNSKENIIQALNVQDQTTDVICVARGGSDNLTIFDDNDICKLLLDHKKIIASAIGHAKDVTFFEKMADAKFATPTAFGNSLKNIYLKTQEDLAKNRSLYIDTLSSSIKHKYENTFSELKESIISLKSDADAKDMLIENITRKSVIDKEYITWLKNKQRNVLRATFVVTLIAFLIMWKLFASHYK